MEPNLQRRSFQLRAPEADDSTGIVTAYVSVYGNVDDHGTIIAHGAFAESLTKLQPGSSREHNFDPIALPIEIVEVAPDDPSLPDELKGLGGLRTKTQYYPDIQASWETYLKIKRGIYRSYSITFVPETSEPNEDGVEVITKAMLLEYGPVFIGSNDLTMTVEARSAMGISAETALASESVTHIVNRWDHRYEKRVQEETRKGAMFSSENMKELESFRDTLRAELKRLESLIGKAQANKQPSTEEARAIARRRIAAVRARRARMQTPKQETTT